MTHLPGRLGDPSMDLGSDPRTDPRLIATLAPFGLQELAPPPPVGVDGSVEEMLAFAAQAEEGFEAVFAALAADLPEVNGVERDVVAMPREDGSELTLYVSRPSDQARPVPGILHLHGGGMAILKARDPLYGYWRDRLAAAGAVVVGVEFRNSAGGLGAHPFPAGLDDCMSALGWLHSQRGELGLSSLILNGDSGGANLVLASVLRSKQEGRLDHVDGAFAMVPYISGLWDRPEMPAQLTSLPENDGYFIGSTLLGVLARLYDPERVQASNPLAWPFHAGPADLDGLPPHVISTNELDPLRDEGLHYLRALQAAGVDAIGHTINGVCHIGELMSPGTNPALYAETVGNVIGFARSVAVGRAAAV